MTSSAQPVPRAERRETKRRRKGRSNMFPFADVGRGHVIQTARAFEEFEVSWPCVDSEPRNHMRRLQPFARPCARSPCTPSHTSTHYVPHQYAPFHTMPSIPCQMIHRARLLTVSTSGSTRRQWGVMKRRGWLRATCRTLGHYWDQHDDHRQGCNRIHHETNPKARPIIPLHAPT